MYDRSEEQLSMLQQITDIIREEQPDALVVSGDVFHNAQPSAAAQTMFTDAILGMVKACPNMKVIVTAGNHDSGTRHEVFRSPWLDLNVFMIGTLDETLEKHIVEIPNKGFIVAVPYAHTRNMPDNFYQTLLDAVAERNQNQLPVVLSAHTTVKGCDASGHELSTDYMVGGIDYMEMSEMGSGYDYLALGHIHHAQFVQGGNHRVRYSGTPLAVSFDENYQHSVTIVELEGHGENATVNCRTREIVNLHPLVTLPENGMTDWDSALQMLAAYPADKPDYIRLNVEVEGYLPSDANAQARKLTDGKQCRFCLINAKRKRTASETVKNMTMSEFQAENPINIAKRYAEDKGRPFDDDMKSLFEEVVRLVREEDNNQ